MMTQNIKVKYLITLLISLLIYNVGVIDAQDGTVKPIGMPPLEWIEPLTADNITQAQPIFTATHRNAYIMRFSDDAQYIQYYTYDPTVP